MVELIEAYAAPGPHEPLPLSDLHQLIDLAAARSPQERQVLLLGLADLYQSEGGQDHAPQALTEVFVMLVRQAEREIRRVLAERLADADWAPVDLVQGLASDAIEIARPVIAASPLLRDADLLALLQDASRDHQIQVALRPALGEGPSRAILDRGDPAVLTALATNRTARLDPADMIRLVESARTIAALRAPLTRHPGLNEDLGLRLYQWVGEALKQAIRQRFNLDSRLLAETIDAASERAAEKAQEQIAERLAAKLHAADQLRPSALIRALREDKLSLFTHALSLLSRLEVEQLRRALQADDARPLFLACMAAGLDRAALPALLRDIRRLNQGRPRGSEGTDRRPAQRTPAQAAHEFRLLMAPDADANV